MIVTIRNDALTAQIDSHGAELKSLQDTNTNQEYMWEGDPEYWGRTSPVLFPNVGSLKNKEFIYNGTAYPMGQHGFARDTDFEMHQVADHICEGVLRWNEATYEKYPFHFALTITYTLNGRSLTVAWKVENLDTKEILPFSIGGHPAFVCPLGDERQQDYYLEFDADNIECVYIANDGLLGDNKQLFHLENHRLPLWESLFDEDALIIENHQAQKVSLVKPNGTVYLTVSFDAPLFGLWSPARKHAPFVCIEPWYGRCDHMNFHGTLEERTWGQVLQAGETFQASYDITV